MPKTISPGDDVEIFSFDNWHKVPVLVVRGISFETEAAAIGDHGVHSYVRELADEGRTWRRVAA